ncbi:MAG: YbaN family protein [Thermoanaerobaculia bacterium]
MNGFKRALLIATGVVAMVFAILGIVLPLLPATPFLLIASACFVRSSDTLYQRLMGNRVFGTYIRNFREGRGIPLRAKIVTLMILWASLAISIIRVELLVLELALIGSGFIASFFIVRMRTAPARD